MTDRVSPSRSESGVGPRAASWVVAWAFGLTAAACGGEHEFEPPDREARVEEAESLYTTALFDTVAWESEEMRTLEGNAVFSAHCRRCHGPLGEGGTEYAAERGLEVPSLVAPDWEHGDSVDAVRRRIFAGHPEGMPTWGVAGITFREIDAVAYYLVHDLRPEVLGGG